MQTDVASATVWRSRVFVLDFRLVFTFGRRVVFVCLVLTICSVVSRSESGSSLSTGMYKDDNTPRKRKSVGSSLFVIGQYKLIRGVRCSFAEN